jgi:hypothetical protein
MVNPREIQTLGKAWTKLIVLNQLFSSSHLVKELRHELVYRPVNGVAYKGRSICELHARLICLFTEESDFGCSG